MLIIKIEYTVATIRKLPQLASLLKKDHLRVIEETVDDALLMVTVKINTSSDENKKMAIRTVQDLFGKSIKVIQESL